MRDQRELFLEAPKIRHSTNFEDRRYRDDPDTFIGKFLFTNLTSRDWYVSGDMFRTIFPTGIHSVRVTDSGTDWIFDWKQELMLAKFMIGQC